MPRRTLFIVMLLSILVLGNVGYALPPCAIGSKDCSKFCIIFFKDKWIEFAPHKAVTGCPYVIDAYDVQGECAIVANYDWTGECIDITGYAGDKVTRDCVQD